MATVTQPSVFYHLENLTAQILNANDQGFLVGFANIDHTNMGSVGLFASNFLPTGSSSATFGGNLAYTFPAALANNTTFYPPVFTAAGAGVGVSEHYCFGQVTTTFGSNLVQVNIAGAAAFSSPTSYSVFVCSNVLTVVPSVTPVSGTLFNIFNGSAQNQIPAGTTFYWEALGS